MAAMRVLEEPTSSLLTTDFTNRFIRIQLLPPMLPDESMIKAMSKTKLQTLSERQNTSLRAS